MMMMMIWMDMGRTGSGVRVGRKKRRIGEVVVEEEEEEYVFSRLIRLVGTGGWMRY